MALFAVTRFMGDDSDNEVDDGASRAASLLQKLQNEVNIRQKKKHSFSCDSSNTVNNHDKTSHSPEHSPVERTEKRRKKIKTIEDNERHTERVAVNHVSTEFCDQNSVQEIYSSPDRKKTKKRKHKLTEGVDSSTSDSAIGVESNVDESSVTDSGNPDRSPKKRKLQHEKTGTKESVVTTQTKTKEKNRRKSKDKVVVSKQVASSEKKDKHSKKTADHDEEEGEEQEEEDGEAPVIKGGPNEIDGFTVLGDIRPKKVEKVKRVLPYWLSNPSVIGTSLKHERLPVTDMPGLDQDLVEKLQKNNITHFFPVQMHVIPILLDPVQTGYHIGRAGYRPNDVCVSAPTGSGKTLAFVIPIVQALQKRVVCRVRALAVLPVRDLAVQVFKVFQTYCQGTQLKVGLMVGQKTFDLEQQTLVRRRLNGIQSQVDIVVATPGRLVDHINKTEGFDLSQLRFLVIDEADRMMDEIKQDWLSLVEAAVYSGDRKRPGPLTAASCSQYVLPLQKLLYSATLSQNPEKLQQLNLFQPKLFTSVVKETLVAKETKNKKNPQNTDDSGVDNEKGDADAASQGEFVGKYTTPAELTEYRVEVTAPNKPLVVLHFLHNLSFRQVLCFTNSIEATHRLYWLIKLMGGIRVREFSSNLLSNERQKIISSFEAGKIDILICSDAMARGIDLENVKYVISYDPPNYIKTYVHRIGRTARAGKTGSAITLLQKSEFLFFKKMLREAGKQNLQKMNVPKSALESLIPKFKEALRQLEDVLQMQKKKRKFRS